MSDEEEEQYLVARRKPVAIFNDIKQIHDRFKEYQPVGLNTRTNSRSRTDQSSFLPTLSNL